MTKVVATLIWEKDKFMIRECQEELTIMLSFH